jgi:hypothetical protein
MDCSFELPRGVDVIYQTPDIYRFYRPFEGDSQNIHEPLAAVLMLMKYSPTWQVFMDRLDREFPQWGSNLMLPFPDDYKPPGTQEAAN